MDRHHVIENDEMLGERHRGPHVAPDQHQLPRLPTVPRRADRLIEKVVTKNLAERHWVSTLTPMDTFSPAKKLSATGAFDDYSLTDPHLQVYWEAKMAKVQRKVPARRRPKHTSRSSSATITDEHRGCDTSGDFPKRQVRAASHTPHASASRNASEQHSSASRSLSHGGRFHDDDVADDDEESTERLRLRARCPMPLNERPMTEGEAYCLKTLLCPAADLRSSLTLEHIDLRWLRDMILRRRSTSDVPAHFDTLRDFRVDLLEHDSFHHTPEIPLHDSLINSPRSALVLLRNGVSIYRLLRRPPEYYVSPTESVTGSTLRLRHELAENERLMLLESLRSQYDQMCGVLSVKRAIEIVTEVVEVSKDAARQLAQQRLERDHGKLLREEMRQKRFGDAQIELEEMAIKRAMENDEKITRQKLALEQKLQERGDTLRRKAEEKQRLLLEKRAEQHAATVLAAEEVKRRRDEKARKIEALRSERIHEIHERAERDAERIAESKTRLLEQEAEMTVHRIQVEQLKKARALRFQERKREAHQELLKRSGDEDKRREKVKQAAAESMRMLRDNIEGKLADAAVRHEEFQEEKRTQIKIAGVLRSVRETKARRALERARRAEEAEIEAIAAAAADNERRLRDRQRDMEKEAVVKHEESDFVAGQRLRVVQTKSQQSEFDKLIALAHMQLHDERIEGQRELDREAVLLTREGDKAIRLRRSESKRMLEVRRVSQGKELFRRTMTLPKLRGSQSESPSRKPSTVTSVRSSKHERHHTSTNGVSPSRPSASSSSCSYNSDSDTSAQQRRAPIEELPQSSSAFSDDEEKLRRDSSGGRASRGEQPPSAPPARGGAGSRESAHVSDPDSFCDESSVPRRPPTSQDARSSGSGAAATPARITATDNAITAGECSADATPILPAAQDAVGTPEVVPGSRHSSRPSRRGRRTCDATGSGVGDEYGSESFYSDSFAESSQHSDA